MAVTVRGAIYAATLPGTVALPAGTAAGDMMVLVLYRFGTDPSYTYPQPDSSAITYYYQPGPVIEAWQRIDGRALGVSATGIYFRTVLAGDITAGTIAVSNAATAAVLITFTAEHLMLFPSDWNGSLGGPVFTEYGDTSYATGGHATFTYNKGYPATVLYVGVFSSTDATAAIDTGTTLLAAPDMQQIIASYGDISTTDPVIVTMTSALTLDWSPTTFTGAALIPLTIREIGDSTAGADNFADAKLITLAADGDTYVSPVVSNRGYTIEPGEPLHRLDWGDGTYDDVGYRSAWWKYTPATSGSITIDTSLSPGDGYADTTLFLFTGDSVDDLTEIAFDDDGGGRRDSRITADVDNGRTYHIKVSNWGADDDVPYCLRLTGPASSEPAGAGNITLSCPPIQTAITAPASNDPLGPPDNFAVARLVRITTDGATYTSQSFNNSLCTVETNEPHTASTPYLRRTLWWTYTPLHSGTVTVTTAGSVAPVEGDIILLEIHVYDGTALTNVTEVASGRGLDHFDGGYIAEAAFYAYAGHTYYIQVGDDSGAGASAIVVLTAAGPANIGAPTLAVDAPAIQAPASIVAAPPVRLAFANPSPADGVVIPVLRPTFSLTIVRGEAEAITVTVTAHIVPTGGGLYVATMTKDVTLTYASNTVSLTAPADLTPGTDYYWEIIVSYTEYPLYSLYSRRFTVAGAGQAATAVPVTWSVAGATPTPHLWFVRPAAGAPGDQITAVGQGATAGSITVAGLAVTDAVFTQIAATGATTGRAINPYTGAVDAEHFQATFTVPDVAAPGGPVVITS